MRLPLKSLPSSPDVGVASLVPQPSCQGAGEERLLAQVEEVGCEAWK